MNKLFHFKEFTPDFKLRFQANLVLNRILDLAPYGSSGMGLLEKQESGDYRCALDLYSSQGPFIVSALGATPEDALEAMEANIKRQIFQWKSRRYAAGPPLSQPNAS